MNVYLSSPNSNAHCRDIISDSPYLLESFVYFQEWQRRLINDDFLLDSGAFTFLKKNSAVDWEEYVRRYAEFINENKIKLFFELDIDAIVGIEGVERLRALLERLTARQCIPVWHKGRGKDYFLQMVREYPYIAIGGLATKEIPHSEYDSLPWFIDKAHEQGCKIHGLGFTSIKLLAKYRFDSVDSSTWINGRRFGIVFEYKDGQMIKHSRKEMQIDDYKKADVHNLREWIKFQRYAEQCL